MFGSGYEVRTLGSQTYGLDLLKQLKFPTLIPPTRIDCFCIQMFYRRVVFLLGNEECVTHLAGAILLGLFGGYAML